jgi:hypothetical protein
LRQYDDEPQKIVFVLFYVDDMMIAGNSTQLIDKVKQKFKLRFALKDMGPKLERIKDGLWIGQPNYIKDILLEMDMWNVPGTDIPGQTKSSPMSTSW